MHLIKVRVPYMNSNDDSNIQEVLIALSFRVIYNGMSLAINLRDPSIPLVMDGYFIFTQICGMIENGITEGQCATILILVGFVQNVL